MDKKTAALNAVAVLKKRYPRAICSLSSESPLELLIATRLSAQCTDARVNLVTPQLFSRYRTVEEYAAADIEDISAIIHSCGFYRIKAADIVNMAKRLISDFGGEVPSTIEELTTLPGVGRKTANLICGDVFGKPAIVADTHLIRITNRLGLCDSKNPLIVERELRELIPPEESNDFCHRCVMYGREVCTARSPKCGDCDIVDCPSRAQSEKNESRKA